MKRFLVPFLFGIFAFLLIMPEEWKFECEGQITTHQTTTYQATNNYSYDVVTIYYTQNSHKKMKILDSRNRYDKQDLEYIKTNCYSHMYRYRRYCDEWIMLLIAFVISVLAIAVDVVWCSNESHCNNCSASILCPFKEKCKSQNHFFG